VGETDFAKGEWCGVELDEPLGKNDGAVAGTRCCVLPNPAWGMLGPTHLVGQRGVNTVWTWEELGLCAAVLGWTVWVGRKSSVLSLLSFGIALEGDQ